MHPSILTTVRAAFLMLVGIACVIAEESSRLPIRASGVEPALLLELGGKPEIASNEDSTTRRFWGGVSAHDETSSIQTDDHEVSTLHPGFGNWKVDFRFAIKAGFPAGPYTFWARWRQGGEPVVCVQTFEVWAGPDSQHLAKRGTFSMKPKGWDYAWIAAESPLPIQADDAVIEVRNSGAGHDAKVFDAFLLARPWSALPAAGTVEQPLVLLELGKAPALAVLEKTAERQMLVGSATAGIGAEALLTENDEVQVFHQGFGSWGVRFTFPLAPKTRPGQYRFFARYKSGGEVSQVRQHFKIKAGASPDQLATRTEFELINNTPWEYQWLEAEAKVTLLPGDRWLEIENDGKADGAKVFDAFLLKLESPLGDWMQVEQAGLRNRFLALAQSVPGAKRRLYLLDGKGDSGEILFKGLITDAARSAYRNLSVSYSIGSDAEAMAGKLNIQALPAAVITDDHYTILGVLSQPKNEQDVSRFLNEPDKFGAMPKPALVAGDEPKPLNRGIPRAWLVGGLQDGRAGLSVYGLDSETVLRPNPDQPYLGLQMMGGEMLNWRTEASHADGSVDIEATTRHAYGWSRGSGYAQIYLHAEQSMPVQLHLQHSGIAGAAWLDGRPLHLADDPHPPAASSWSPGERAKSLLQGLTTEGLVAKAWSERPQAPQSATVNLELGWHSLLFKSVMQHEQGRRFYFAGQFTDEAGRPLENLETRLSDPEADLALNAVAAKLRPTIFNDAPANLPQPGDPIKLRVDMRWHPILEETSLAVPLPRFPARMRLRLVDYGGKEIAVREVNGLFPGSAEVDFPGLAEPGYYAVYPSLHTQDGRLIMSYPADGFSVVGGSSAQKQRLNGKKVWNNDYYALADADKSFVEPGGYFAWLERMGLYKSYGSYPGFEPQYRAQWQQAKQHGLLLFADSAGDSAWLNDNPEDGQKFVDAVAPYTRFFKASNEIDIRLEPEWQKLRDPAHWVARAEWEYRQSHKARGDAHYVGGSLVRPGDAQAPGQWFEQVLRLGLDRYQDAWDVHAYPQQAPRFGGAIGNGPDEDERGVLATYARLGKVNRLPFWLGETGAKAMHGSTGRRWQAEQVAKMVAWVNSRNDYLGLAFCIAHEYDQAYGRIWDYSMGHKPGEAALYTASALIDGLPYKSYDTKDAGIQAAYFGETLMVWRSDEGEGEWQLHLVPGKRWVVVNVVGQVRDVAVDASGKAGIAISGSPVYVLERAEYERLIGA